MKDIPFTEARLLSLYDRVVEAEDAIPRLRRFVLDLAVRGKLVPQEAGDEPASVLLARIEKEKSRLVKAGEIGKPKPLGPLTETPFSVPASWAWERLGKIALYLQRGKSPEYAQGAGLPVISQKCVQWTGLDLTHARRIVPASIAKYESIRFIRDGDLLWNSTGTGTIGRVVRVGDPPTSLVCDSHVTVVRCCLVNPEFVRCWLRSDHVYGGIEGTAAGSTNQVELTSQMANGLAVPLPPLAEQHRIVAKVEELMALLDRLEAARAAREETRTRLTAATLSRLTEADTDTPTATRFALQTLPALTTRPDQIKTLRQTILNLAVRGKLVEQDAGDESAEDLLKEISFEASPSRRRNKFGDAGLTVERHTDQILPQNWTWTTLAEIAGSMRYGTSVKCERDLKGVPVLRIPNVSNGVVNLNDLKFGPLSEDEKRDLSLRAGDLLLIRSNGSLEIVGRSAVVTEQAEGMAFAGYLVRVRLAAESIVPDYVWLVLNSSSVREQIEKPIRSAVGLKNVNLTEFGSLSIPLPPFAEQHRIVAKVEELMSLCDRLERALQDATTTRARLLDATLREALEGAQVPELVQ